MYAMSVTHANGTYILLYHVYVQIPATGYIGHILCSTTVATLSWSTFEDTMTLLWQKAEKLLTVHAVAAEYPHSTLNGTLVVTTVVLRHMRPM